MPKRVMARAPRQVLGRVLRSAPRRVHAESDPEPPAAPGTPATWPLLGSRGFWRRARVAQTSERAHFAGVLSFVLLLLTIDALFELAPALTSTDPDAWTGIAADKAPIALIGAIVSVLLMVTVVVVISLSVNDTGGLSVRATRRLATTVLVASAVCYVAWTLWCVFGIARGGDGSGDERFEGLSVAPVAITTICALIALSSLTWPYRVRRVLSAAALVAAFICVLFTYPEIPDDTRWALSLVALALALFALALGYLWHPATERARRKLIGWHGNGPAVIMLLALFSSMVITSLLVIGAHAWLSTSTEPPTTSDRIWRVLPASPTFALIPPAFYEQFAVSLLAILALFVLLAIAVGITAFARMPRLTVPDLAYPDPTDDRRKRADRNRGGTERPDGPGYPISEANLHDKERVVATARRLAALAHRGEQLLAWLAILTAVTLLLLAMPIVTLALAEWQYWALFKSIAGWALGLFALAIVAAVVANAVTSAERPLGLIWDIICYFPRAAHPFTPPCYAERTVPEIEERLEDWFRGDTAHERSAILSAHSMGAPIVVAVAFSVAADGAALDHDDTVPIERIALLTYGVQLRAYFGRFFPAVFGPQVLGTQGTYAPSLFRRDPWDAEVKREWQIPPKRAKAADVPGDGAPENRTTPSVADVRPGVTATHDTATATAPQPHPQPPWSRSSAGTSPRAGPRGGEASGVAPTISASRSSRTEARATPWIAGRVNEHRARTSGPWHATTTTCRRCSTSRPATSCSASYEARATAQTRTRPISIAPRDTFSRRPAPGLAEPVVTALQHQLARLGGLARPDARIFGDSRPGVGEPGVRPRHDDDAHAAAPRRGEAVVAELGDVGGGGPLVVERLPDAVRVPHDAPDERHREHGDPRNGEQPGDGPQGDHARRRAGPVIRLGAQRHSREHHDDGDHHGQEHQHARRRMSQPGRGVR